MSRLEFTRREFSLMLMTSSFALSAGGKAQEPVPESTARPSVDAINAWLPQPLPDEQAGKVAQAIKSLQETAKALRAHPLPEGSEPAFTCHPVSAAKRRR